MNTHPEQELLSPFVDGELTEREQVTLEAHLASCEDCRSVLDALRATLGDLALLGVAQAAPSAQDSWALRSAIAKEQRLGRRGRRWYLISGGAAAALVGILAFALSTGGGQFGSGARSAMDAAQGANGPGLVVNSVNYTDSSARAVLFSFSSKAPASAQLKTRDSTSGAGGTTTELSATTQALTVPAETGAGQYFADGRPVDQAAVDRCVQTVTSGSSRPMSARHYEAARFDGKPAFLLVFEVPSMKRLELWVVNRDTCDTLFFAQTQS